MTLRHQDYHIPLIRRYEKTVTRRDWKPAYNRPIPGSVHMAVSRSMNPDKYPFIPDEDCDCYVVVGHARDEPLGEITDESAQREGDYQSVAEFKEGWERIHGIGSWDPDKVVSVVPYLYVGSERPDESELQRLFCPECSTLMERVEGGLRCRDPDCLTERVGRTIHGP